MIRLHPLSYAGALPSKAWLLLSVEYLHIDWWSVALLGHGKCGPKLDEEGDRSFCGLSKDGVSRSAVEARRGRIPEYVQSRQLGRLVFRGFQAKRSGSRMWHQLPCC